MHTLVSALHELIFRCLSQVRLCCSLGAEELVSLCMSVPMSTVHLAEDSLTQASCASYFFLFYKKITVQIVIHLKFRNKSTSDVGHLGYYLLNYHRANFFKDLKKMVCVCVSLCVCAPEGRCFGCQNSPLVLEL